MTDAEDIGRRLAEVRSRVAEAAAREIGRKVVIVAVSKTVPLEGVRAAYAAGQRVFGENRVQEAVEKMARARVEMPDSEWHLVGHLQTNKARAAVEAFDIVESVDSLRLARKLDREAERIDRKLPVLIEINVAGEAAKSGMSEPQFQEALPDLLALAHLDLRGLMTVAPLVSDAEQVRLVFRRLRELRDETRNRFPLTGFNELSMGMSNDYLVAVEEGSTIVRIGRAIFGERPAA